MPLSQPNDDPEFQGAPARSERIHSRLRPEQKERFEYAATLEGLSLSEFLIRSAEERAQRVLQEHEMLVLRGQDSANFVSLLMNPPPPNDALKEAFKEYARDVESR